MPFSGCHLLIGTGILSPSLQVLQHPIWNFVWKSPAKDRGRTSFGIFGRREWQFQQQTDRGGNTWSMRDVARQNRRFLTHLGDWDWYRYVDISLGSARVATRHLTSVLDLLIVSSGIVPILSLYKQHVRQLLRLDPLTHFANLENYRRRIVAAEKALAPQKRSLVQRIVRSFATLCQRQTGVLDADTNAAVGPEFSVASNVEFKIQRHERMSTWTDAHGNIRGMNAEAFQATRFIYRVVFYSLLPAFGILLIGMTISMNTTSANQREGLTFAVQAATALFQLTFAFLALFIWDANHLLTFFDAALCLVTPFADWYWWLQYVNNQNGRLAPCDITTYCLLTGYMTLRLWSQSDKSCRKIVTADAVGAMDELGLVWVSRSASLVSELMPDINCIWDTLAEQWGKENAFKACKISVFVTDRDETACVLLRKELSSTRLFQDGAIKFCRPDFASLIQDHTIRMISTRQTSYSLLAFCG
jgi:hypothetical protein